MRAQRHNGITAKRSRVSVKRVRTRAVPKERMIALRDYPQLADIAWNKNQPKIPESEAFALYERNWRFIDTTRLLLRERNLIERLAKIYGHGIIHASVSPSSSPAHR